MSKKRGYVLIAVVYLLGLFIGALDTGIVTPARTVIQSGLGVDEQLGIWLITIYTLAYAAAIPVMGKLADKFGRKGIYLVSVALFGIGSLFCGLAQDFGSFPMLLVARAVQAVGGGGIMPVATAEFGTAFPEEKRGMALGLVGGVYGIANVFGASAGSLILDIFGQQNWQFIFYVNVPICVFIFIAGVVALPNAKERDVRPIDFVGTIVLIIMILSLLYGLKNLDLFDFANSVRSVDVYPFLIVFVVLIPVFVLIERRAADPILNLSYFKSLSIVVTLLLSIITGIVMMGMVFIPQFAENALLMPSGSGGYFVIVLGLFAGFGAPMSGRFIDRFGVKIVLGFGLVVSVAGSLFLMLVAARYPSVPTVVVSLILLGIGIGFTMGTPLNYMMLEKTDESESNSALATLSLVRSIGTTVAPAIMVAFLAHAGANAETAIMDELPDTVTVPVAAQAQAVSDDIDAIPDSAMKDEMLSGLDLDALTEPRVIDLSSMGGDGEEVDVPEEVVAAMQGADATTIVDATKLMATSMFEAAEPEAIASAQEGIGQGVEALDGAIGQMEAASPAAAAAGAVSQLSTLRDDLAALEEAIPATFDEALEGYLGEIDARAADIQATFQRVLNDGFGGMFALVAACSAVGVVLLAFYRDDRAAERKASRRASREEGSASAA